MHGLALGGRGRMVCVLQSRGTAIESWRSFFGCGCGKLSVDLVPDLLERRSIQTIVSFSIAILLERLLVHANGHLLPEYAVPAEARGLFIWRHWDF